MSFLPSSLRVAYEHDIAQAIAIPGQPPRVTVPDLQSLPDPVQRYLRLTEVIGQRRVRNFRVRMHGRIRSGPSARWMTFSSEQYNTIEPRSRFFYMTASMFGIPAQGYHRYAGSSATMEVKAAGLVPVVNASGAEMTQSETVTLFNDMCVMAPATLIDPSIEWDPVNERIARARFTNACHTISAELTFNDDGELIDFVSDDRYQLLPGGKVSKTRWSTPLRSYRSFRGVPLTSGGEGRWHEPGNEYAYIELTIDDVAYNVRSAP